MIVQGMLVGRHDSTVLTVVTINFTILVVQI